MTDAERAAFIAGVKAGLAAAAAILNDVWEEALADKILAIDPASLIPRTGKE